MTIAQKVQRARENATAAKRAAEDIALRVLDATGTTRDQMTPLDGDQAWDVIRTRPTELPSRVVGAGLYKAMSKLDEACNVVLNSAAQAEQLRSESLAQSALNMSAQIASALTFVRDSLDEMASVASYALPGFTGLTGGSYYLVTSNALSADLGALGAWTQVLGGAVVLAAAIYIVIKIIDKVDGVDSEAQLLAREACTEQFNATGRRCTDVDFRRYFTEERQREAELERQRDPLSKLGDALFWLLLIGGVGVGLYFAAPLLTAKAVETETQYRTARARARAKEAAQ